MGCNSSLLSLDSKIQQQPNTAVNFSDFIKANSSQVFETYKFCNWINRSKTSMVRKVIHKHSEAERVVKIYHRQEINQQKAMNQINALKKLDHPNIIRLYEYYMDQSFIYIILQKIDGLPLYDHLLGTDEGVKEHFPNIFKQLLSAVEHCHSLGIVHRNITSDNILIFKNQSNGSVNYVVKLIDFAQVYFLPKSCIEDREKQRQLRKKAKENVINVEDLQNQNPNKNQLLTPKAKIATKKIKLSNINSVDIKQVVDDQSNAPEVRIKSNDINAFKGLKKKTNGKNHKEKKVVEYMNSSCNYRINPIIPNSQGSRNIKITNAENQPKQQNKSLFKVFSQQRKPEREKQNFKQQDNKSKRQVCDLEITDITNEFDNQEDIFAVKKHEAIADIENIPMESKQNKNLEIPYDGRRQRPIKSLEKLYIRQNPQEQMYSRSEITKLRMKINRKISNLFDAPQDSEIMTIEKQDIWFCGIVLFTLVTGKNLLAQAKPARQCINKLIEQWAEEHPDADQISDMMMKMLAIEPEQRPHAYECLEHKFLKQKAESGSQWKLTMVYKFLHDYKVEHHLKSLFAMYITRQISTVNDQSEFMMEFANLDTNKDGILQYSELMDGLINSFTIDGDAAKSYVDQIFNSLDKNKNGCIEYSEFLMGTLSINRMIKDDSIRKLFNEIDKNRDGFITNQELQILFEGVDEQQNFDSLLQIKRVSESGINYEQFQAFIKQMMVSRCIM